MPVHMETIDIQNVFSVCIFANEKDFWSICLSGHDMVFQQAFVELGRAGFVKRAVLKGERENRSPEGTLVWAEIDEREFREADLAVTAFNNLSIFRARKETPRAAQPTGAVSVVCAREWKIRRRPSSVD